MNDAFGNNIDHLRPGDRIALVGDVGTGQESKTTRLGSQGTLGDRRRLIVDDPAVIEVILDDERRVVVSPNMITEDDELPLDPDKRHRVEQLIHHLTQTQAEPEAGDMSTTDGLGAS